MNLYWSTSSSTLSGSTFPAEMGLLVVGLPGLSTGPSSLREPLLPESGTVPDARVSRPGFGSARAVRPWPGSARAGRQSRSSGVSLERPGLENFVARHVLLGAAGQGGWPHHCVGKRLGVNPGTVATVAHSLCLP